MVSRVLKSATAHYRLNLFLFKVVAVTLAILILLGTVWWAVDEVTLYATLVLDHNKVTADSRAFKEVKDTGVRREGIVGLSTTEPIYSGAYNTDSLGYFGAMWFWLEYETGCTANSAFDSVTLNDGLGGQAYGVQFDLNQGSLQGFISYCLKQDPAKWSMFKGLDTASKQSLYAYSESDIMPAAWHDAYDKDADAFIALQKEYIKSNFSDPVIARLEKNGYQINSRSTVVKGALLSYAHQHGPGYIQERQLQRAGITNADSDEEFLKKLYGYRTATYGNFGGLSLSSRYARELPTALALLAEEQQLASQSGPVSPSEDRFLHGATIDNTGKIVIPNLVDWQPKIIEIAKSGTVGYTSGWCEQFVGDFYDYLIGYAVVRRYCCARNDKFTERLSEDYNKMPAGALIYSDENYKSRTWCRTCGRNAGHVALYIGNDTIVGAQNSYVMTKEGWYSSFGWGGFGFNLDFPSFSASRWA